MRILSIVESDLLRYTLLCVLLFSIIPCIKNVEILACTFNDLVQRERLGEVLGFTFVCHAFFNVTSLSLNFFETQDNFSLEKKSRVLTWACNCFFHVVWWIFSLGPDHVRESLFWKWNFYDNGNCWILFGLWIGLNFSTLFWITEPFHPFRGTRLQVLTKRLLC